MRKIEARLFPALFTAALFASVAFFGAGAAHAQMLPPEGTISTQGHGEVKVKPDSLSVMLMVESTHEGLAEARAENSRKMAAIIESLKRLDIPDLKLETQNVQVYPMMGEYQKDRLPKTLGYRVTNGLAVSVEKVRAEKLAESASRIVDAALTSGATHMNGMNFYLSNMEVPRMQALEAAVRDARKNADALARASNVAITGVYSLEGTPQYAYFNRDMRSRMVETTAMGGGIGNVVTPVEPGEATVTSDVTVRYKF